MVCAPNDPTDQFQPALAIGATATNQSGLCGLLERLDDFMRLANLAAEVRGRTAEPIVIVRCQKLSSAAMRMCEAVILRENSSIEPEKV